MIEKFHCTCLLCNSANVKNMRRYEIHGLVKCSECDFVYMKKIPSKEELENYYSVYSYQQIQEIPEPTRISLENLLDTFEKYRVNNRMLDVGCGEGWILELAKTRGWQVYGTEFSQRALEICEHKGIRMYLGELNLEKFKEKEFDIIISSETIEHINNPRNEISNFYQLLRKGGLLYITTPNFNSYLRLILKEKYDLITYPEHLSYYTKSTLNKLLTNSGLRKIKLLTTGVSFSHYANSKLTDDLTRKKNKDADEKIRKKITRSVVLQSLKKLINRGLTLAGIGMTLKAYYIKK